MIRGGLRGVKEWTLVSQFEKVRSFTWHLDYFLKRIRTQDRLVYYDVLAIISP
jgi:hypothetical protein